MKKILIAITILSLFAGCASLSSHAVSNGNERGTISVNASADTEIAPDVAELSFAIQTFDTKSMQKATVLNKEISDKVYAQLKSLIDSSKGDYLKTSNYSAQPVYSYANSKKTLEKYQVSNRITVHTKSIDKLGKMIDSAIAAGATNVDSLSFSVSNYDAQCNELIGLASKKARSRADVIAKAMFTTIDGVSNVSTSCSSNNYNQPRYYMAKNMLIDAVTESASGGTSTEISNGVIKINANVNANFFVK